MYTPVWSSHLQAVKVLVDTSNGDMRKVGGQCASVEVTLISTGLCVLNGLNEEDEGHESY